MKKTFLLLWAAAYGAMVVNLDADNQPIYNVPSPEVANLGMYGQVPVSYYTGVPDISVPLYEVKVGNFSMPITASYHIGSVKPNQTPGPLGLGWSLMAGGFITRTVRGLYDEKKGYRTAWGFYSHYSKAKNITPSKLEEYVAKDELGSEFDLCADEFYFNFLGYEGNFYLNEDGGWSVSSDSDVKVEFDSITGFASLSELEEANRINKTPGWGNRGKNQRFFIRFSIVGPDGTRYEFGGINATEFSISYYNRNNSDLVATSWRLTKITTPEKHVITFDYEGTSKTCDIEYRPYLEQRYNQSHPAGEQINAISEAGFSGYLNFPVNLMSITTPNETIEFTYNYDLNYRDRLNRMDPVSGGTGALYWNKTFLSWFGLENLSPTEKLMYQNAIGFTQFFNVEESDAKNSEEITTNDLLKEIMHYLLHRIAVRKNNTDCSQSIYFDYSNAGREKLSLISVKDYIPELLRDTIFVPDGYFLITNYRLPKKDADRQTIDHQFQYNLEKRLIYGYICSKTDSWGYWNGDTIRLYKAVDPQVIRPNFEATMAEVLTDIIYPTGGRTHFEYELNNYSKLVDIKTHTRLNEETGTAGGLRIKNILNIDRNGNFVSKRRYYYSKERVPNDAMTSSGICKGLPTFYSKYVLPDYEVDFNGGTVKRQGAKVYRCSSDGVYAPVTNMNSPIVGYTWVIEETMDSIGNSLGSIRYRYSNYDTDMEGNSHVDSLCYYTENTHNAFVEGYSPYMSNSFERGKLLSKEYMDSNDEIFKKEIYKYKRTSHAPLVTVYYERRDMDELKIYHNVSNPICGVCTWLLHTHTASYLPVSVTESIRSTDGKMVETGTRTYEYNNHKMLKRETATMSDGTEQSVSYTYPYDYGTYDWMTKANITEPIVEKRLTAGEMTRFEKNDYANVGGIPYIQKRTTGNGSTDVKTEYEVKRVDRYGNPVEMVINGVNNVLCWGHQGQRLLARVENAEFRKLKYLLNLPATSTSIDYSSLLNSRSQLPSAMFHIYTYTPDLLLQSETTPNGMTTFYGYDGFGRLKEVYYIEGGEKKLLKSFGYQYYNGK